MQSGQRKIGVILSYVSQGISILSGLLYTPVMLRLLGQNEYGLYQVAYSVISYLGLLNFGFSSSYVRYYSMERAKKNNEEGVSSLNGMFLSIFIVISFLCLVCGAILVLNIRAIFGTGLTEDEYAKAEILMGLMIFNMIISMLTTLFSCYITAHEQFLVQRLITIGHNLLNPFLTLPLLLAGFGSVGMVAISTLLTCTEAIINVLYCFKKLSIKIRFKGFDKAKLQDMGRFTFFIFLNQIVDQINNSIDNVLLGRMAGTAVVAVYGVGAKIKSMYQSLSTSISGVFTPIINKMVAEDNNDEELTDLFIKVGRIQYLLLLLVLSGFIFFGKIFIKYWAGDGYDESYTVALLLMVPAIIPLIQNSGVDIQRAKNKHQVRSIVYTIMAVANLLISIILIQIWGATGAAMGTAITVFLANGLFMNWYYYKHIGIDIIRFWKEILSISRGFIPCLLVGVLITRLFSVDSFIQLCIEIVVYAATYMLSMWVIGMNSYEKGMVIKIFQKFMKKNDK